MKKLGSTLSAEERVELQKWASSSPNRQNLLDRLSDPDRLAEELGLAQSISHLRPAEDMQRRISRMKRMHRLKTALRAAAVMLLLAAGGSLYFLIPDIRRGMPEKESSPVIASIEDITPGEVGAVCKLPSGETMKLGSSDTSLMAKTLTIPAAKNANTVSGIDELSLEVGRGHEFKIILEDSTIVYLNSESTLRYPEVFAADSRRVAVSGEAFFEVKPDKKRPFYVESGGQTVRVYGTEFNVRNYADEDAVLTTLKSGSVAISSTGNEDARLFLSPGHQSRFENSDASVTMKAVNPDIVTGWRHGKFVFEETPLHIIMKDLSRWYDFEYEFADNTVRDIVFMGAVSRYSDFRTVITILEDSGEVRFTVKDNKVVISRKRQ